MVDVTSTIFRQNNDPYHSSQVICLCVCEYWLSQSHPAIARHQLHSETDSKMQ